MLLRAIRDLFGYLLRQRAAVAQPPAECFDKALASLASLGLRCVAQRFVQECIPISRLAKRLSNSLDPMSPRELDFDPIFGKYPVYGTFDVL